MLTLAVLRLLPASLLLLCALPLTACDDPDDVGGAGRLQFRERYCGRALCYVTSPLAVGGDAQLVFEPMVAAGDLQGASLVSSDPSVLLVLGTRDAELGGAAIIQGVAPGTVELSVVDAAGAVVDSIDMTVEAPDALEVTVRAVDETLVVPDGTSGEPVFTVRADSAVDVDISPLADGVTLMGVIAAHSVEVDESDAPADAWLVTSDVESVVNGHFQVRVPGATHRVSVSLPDGPSTRFTLRAE